MTVRNKTTAMMRRIARISSVSKSANIRRLMIRRMAGRVRRELAARLVPRRNLLANRLAGVARIGPTIGVILGELSLALLLRLRGAVKRQRVLRVGIDIRPFYEPLTGVGWYLFNLIDELAKRTDVELILLGDPIMTDDGPRLFVSMPAGLRPVVFDLRSRRVANVSRKLASIFYVPLAHLQDCDAGVYLLLEYVGKFGGRSLYT